MHQCPVCGEWCGCRFDETGSNCTCCDFAHPSDDADNLDEFPADLLCADQENER